MKRLTLLALLLASSLASCSFYSTATRWNGRVGPDGEPVFYKTITKVGVNLLIILPFLGHTDIETMVDELTRDVAETEGDVVRIVQGSTENYWYGWSPFTWIITPIVSDLTAEYRPSADELKAAREEDDRIDKESLGVLGL